ncbi:hypothetical protein Sru01_47670 [Sphaerisporangium rufum]|uniref:DUF397 domain-containing protein n=1 Tax=Sphaerisporangium rufum TaxID=1381558 RepID=A0A919V6X5_9ACTN|nr:hypothetical protein Sru01_47670 [Sphaerisporangium rufum]
MSGVRWKKSSYTGDNGGNCVEVADLRKVAGGSIAVRDSKNPDGPKLFCTAAAWTEFLAGISGSGFRRG